MVLIVATVVVVSVTVAWLLVRPLRHAESPPMRRSPFRPCPRQPDPEKPVHRCEPQPVRARPLQHVELVLQREHLESAGLHAYGPNCAP